MTSTASQQNPPAPNSSSTAAPSYASAAGATKKPTSTPVIASGSNPPTPSVVVGSSNPSSQNGKAPIPAVNGRPNITPAVPTAAPAVVRGSSVNGGAHNRTSSVTISANGPPGHVANGSGPIGNMKAANIPQFGYESPAVAHSTPQPGATAPIPIPSVPSPAHSPSPIPQTSGGQRAPSTSQAPLTFGSFPGDGDVSLTAVPSIQAPTPSLDDTRPLTDLVFQRQMNKPAIPQNPMAMSHGRRDSQASGHGDHNGHGPSRGGYQGGRGGRGGQPHFTPQYNGQPMGYPPNNQNFGGNRGRGGMYQGGRGGPAFNQSPRPSPVAAHALPSQNTPTMPQAVMAPGAQQFYPPPPPMYPHHQQHVNNPSFLPPLELSVPRNAKGSKKNGMRRDSAGFSRHPRHLGPSSRPPVNEFSHRPRRYTNPRWGTTAEGGPSDVNGGYPPEYSDGPSPRMLDLVPARRVSPPSLYIPPPQASYPLDLSPETGNFDKLLTASQKQMGAPYSVPLNQFGQPMYPNQYAQQQMYGPPPNSQGFHNQYPPQFTPAQPGGAPMSRNSSQISERPASSTGQSQAPVIAQGTPQQRAAQPAAAPAIVSSSTFVRQKKSAAIVIKNPAGEVVDLKSQMKTPASPAPSLQSKTPPIVASTPTPPPKPSTPSHARSESTVAGKTAEQLRNEFRDQIAQRAKEIESKEASEKTANEEKAKEEQLREEERLKAEKQAEEEAKAKAAAEAEAKAKAKADAEAKAKAEAKAEEEAKAKAEAEAAAAKKAAEAAEPNLDDEDEMERMIREMEEEDARREKEQAAITEKKKIEAAEAKKRADVDRAASSAENDRKLREQEREMERLEEEKEQKRRDGEAKDSVADLLAKKIDDLKLSETKDSAASIPSDKPGADAGSGAKAGGEKARAAKPAALNLAPLNTKSVEPPQPSAALQSLKSARFLTVMGADIYPAGIASPNPSLNAAVAKKGKTFKYDAQFLLQFQKVFTEQPSTEFHQQVKTLIGDSDGGRAGGSARTPGAGSSRQNTRTNALIPGGMGNFDLVKSLPPNSTSEQRFAISQANGGRLSMNNPIGGFGRPGSFPGPSQMSRTPSSNMGGAPGSPRQPSRSTRGGSKRGEFGNNKSDAQTARAMPLTQGMKIEAITTSAGGWKPMSLGKQPSAPVTSNLLDPETVQRKVKSALNKMTPEKFDKISDQILEISSQSKNEQDGRTLRQVIQLTFEKATDESHWASMYARFCKRMLDTMSPEIRDETVLDKSGVVVSGGALFRKYLLNRCQEDFERGWKVDLPEPKEGESKEIVLMSEEYYTAAAAKRRGLGLVQFIGELYKLGMLTERIMHECVRKLLEFNGIPDEAEIESLTKLLRTIGVNLDNTEKGRHMMDAYFQRIQSIVDLPELPSRLKFMLMDIRDLRSKNWISKEQNKGPKTLDEIRADVRPPPFPPPPPLET